MDQQSLRLNLRTDFYFKVDSVFTLITILLMLDSGRQPTNISHEYVDLVELNCKYDEETDKLAYTQVLFWEWSPDWQRMHIVAWYITEQDRIYEMPTKVGKEYLTIRRYEGKEIHVHAKRFKLSHTYNDPERDNKKILDEKYRRGFGRKQLPDLVHP